MFLGSHSLDSGYLRRADIKHFLSGISKSMFEYVTDAALGFKTNRGFGYLTLMRAAQSW